MASQLASQLSALLGFAILALLKVSFLIGLSAGNLYAEEVDFNEEVRPILSQHCFHCHGPDAAERQADLRLDDGQWLSDDPSNAQELLRRVLSEDESEVMPPPDSHEELTPSEKQTLEAWVSGGGQWTPHWAYSDPVKDLPDDLGPSPQSHDLIDYFVLQKLHQQELGLSERAETHTLIRRLCFDLTGLPPQEEWSEAIEAFATSGNAEDYEVLIDELLASPHFGERMAMYWLDLVRYADTVGDG